MKKHRVEGIEKEIQRVLGKYILENISLKSVENGFLTVNQVKVTNELSFADIFISVLCNKEYDAKSVQNELNSLSKTLRGVVSKEVKIRHTPTFRMHLDNGIEQGIKITNLISDLNNK